MRSFRDDFGVSADGSINDPVAAAVTVAVENQPSWIKRDALAKRFERGVADVMWSRQPSPFLIVGCGVACTDVANFTTIL